MNIDECRINNSSPTNLLEFGFRKNEKRIHEAQKPLDLIEYLIKLTTRENQIVLDPFMGSGTTAIAAKKLNRNFIGFEANPEYHAKSLERIDGIPINYVENSQSFQQTLFEKNG
jgi:site-specific DNA-methyltransferase (adenine-specific)